MLKKIDPKHIAKTVSIEDPAIDEEATGKENLEKFEDTHNIKLLKFKEGEHPTIFHCKNIGGSDQAEIQEQHYKIDMPDISKIKNPKDIKNIKPKAKIEKTTSMMLKYFYSGIKKYEEGGTVHDIETDMFPLHIMMELGSFVMNRATLGDDEKND